MSVRAKFYVHSTTQMIHGGSVILSAVCRGEDNKEWASATPAGRIEMTILNDLAREFFEVGQEVFVDFSLVPEGRKGLPGMDA